MVAALTLTGAALVIATGLAAAARIVHIGNLDAMGLAEKLSAPHAVSALDWPELEIRAVLPQPGESSLVVELRRRQSLERVRGRLKAEDRGPADEGARRRPLSA